jgi:hypothetical protein
MPMKTALSIRLHGEMPQTKLEAMRERLGLQRSGRLTDLEDADLGHLYLRRDEDNLIRLTLYRYEDTQWAVKLTYLNEPPADGTVRRYRSRILDAAAALGFAAEEA